MVVDKTNNAKDHKQAAPEGSQSWQCPVETLHMMITPFQLLTAESH